MLNGKKILVTAGSTWIPIDTVRVITNIFKGGIGLTIAKDAAKRGADVTLLLGPSFDLSKEVMPNNIQVVRFKYFDELDSQLTEQLTENQFDIVIHSAAISDFKVVNSFNGKIKSNTDKLTIELVPTKKLVDAIKNISPKSFLVKFKLEVGINVEQLKEIAYKSMKHSNADMIVANIYDPNFKDHEAYIITPEGEEIGVVGRENISNKILDEIYDRSK